MQTMAAMTADSASAGIGARPATLAAAQAAPPTNSPTYADGSRYGVATRPAPIWTNRTTNDAMSRFGAESRKTRAAARTAENAIVTDIQK